MLQRLPGSINTMHGSLPLNTEMFDPIRGTMAGPVRTRKVRTTICLRDEGGARTSQIPHLAYFMRDVVTPYFARMTAWTPGQRRTAAAGGGDRSRIGRIVSFL